MSRRARPRGDDRKRGRHKRASSPETARWNGEHLPAVRPPWMPEATYRELRELARELER